MCPIIFIDVADYGTGPSVSICKILENLGNSRILLR